MTSAGTGDPAPTAGAATTHAAGWVAGTATMTRVLLVRHGQTAMSIDRRFSGHGDPELTELGERQASATSDVIKRLTTNDAGESTIRAIVSSPLSRCLGTASRLASSTGVELSVDTGLIETDFGEWEGLTFGEAAARDPELHRAWLGNPALAAPGGESFDDVAARVLPTLDKWTRRAEGGTLVVVSHVTPIKLVLREALAGGPEFAYRLHLDLSQISELRRYGDGQSSVHGINSVSHLAGID